MAKVLTNIKISLQLPLVKVQWINRATLVGLIRIVMISIRSDQLEKIVRIIKK